MGQKKDSTLAPFRWQKGERGRVNWWCFHTIEEKTIQAVKGERRGQERCQPTLGPIPEDDCADRRRRGTVGKKKNVIWWAEEVWIVI